MGKNKGCKTKLGGIKKLFMDEYMLRPERKENKEDTRLGERKITVGSIYFVLCKVRGSILYKYCLIV